MSQYGESVQHIDALWNSIQGQLRPVGSRVSVYGHGPGTITAYNHRRLGLYHRGRFPYVIRFDTGFSEVYGLTEVDDEGRWPPRPTE